jgi:hypothetical protein
MIFVRIDLQGERCVGQRRAKYHVNKFMITDIQDEN